MKAQEEFCARMKAERERRGITLESIADSTKIGGYLFAGLEANNFSRWPTGAVYRRGFVRDYANAVGLPIEPTLAEFERLFPELSADDEISFGAALQAAVSPETPRLALASHRRPKPAWSPDRARAAMIDATGVLLVASLTAWLLGTNLWVTVSLLAFAYYVATVAFLGRGIAAWWLSGVAARHGAGREQVVAAPRATRRPPRVDEAAAMAEPVVAAGPESGSEPVELGTQPEPAPEMALALESDPEPSMRLERANTIKRRRRAERNRRNRAPGRSGDHDHASA